MRVVPYRVLRTLTWSANKMKLIPTRHKDKLPREFSYPIGAKEISDAMADVPQYALLSLIFHDKDTFWASEFKERIRNEKVIKVIEVEYFRSHAYAGAPKDFVESGHFEPKWTVKVYALPVQYRHDVNVAIKNFAIPIYVSWLHEIGSIDTYKLHRKSFGFDLAKRDLTEI